MNDGVSTTAVPSAEPTSGPRESYPPTSVVSNVNSSALSAPVTMHPAFATREQASVPTADPSAEPRSGPRESYPPTSVVSNVNSSALSAPVAMHPAFFTREQASVPTADPSAEPRSGPRESYLPTSVLTNDNSSALSSPVTMHLEFATRENVSAPREHPHVPTAAPGAEPVSATLSTYVRTAAPGAEPVPLALSTMQLAIATRENVSAPREHTHVPTAAPGVEPPVSATLSMIQSLTKEEPSPLQPNSRRESNGNEETSSRGRTDNPTVEHYAQTDRYESRFEGHKAMLEETMRLCVVTSSLQELSDIG
jgi:hypothetical protein